MLALQKEHGRASAASENAPVPICLTEGADQGDGLQNATRGVVKRRARRGQLASIDAPVDHPLRPTFVPCLQILPPKGPGALRARQNQLRDVALGSLCNVLPDSVPEAADSEHNPDTNARKKWHNLHVFHAHLSPGPPRLRRGAPAAMAREC